MLSSFSYPSLLFSSTSQLCSTFELTDRRHTDNHCSPACQPQWQGKLPQRWNTPGLETQD
jgi:hypothetical protein